MSPSSSVFPAADPADSASLAKPSARELIDLWNQFGRRTDRFVVTRLLKQSLACAGVVQTLHRLPQAVLREGKPKVAGGYLLHGVGLVKDDEIIRKEVSEPLVLGVT